MKKINNTGQLGGAPVNQGDLRTVFNDEIWDALEALLSMFSADAQGVIVSGGAITGAGPYDISEAIVYLNGEFMRLPAATGQTLPKYIAPATAVNDNRVFADTTTKTLFITKSAELVGAAPGAGQYVAITTTTDPDDRRLSNIWLNSQVASVFRNTLSVIGALTAHSQLTSLANLVVTTTGEILGGIRTQNSGPYLLKKVIEVGTYDMSGPGSTSKNVAHGLADITKIRSVHVVIRSDSAVNLIHDLSGFANATTLAAHFTVTATNVTIVTTAGQYFDGNGSYNDTAASYNRGWITIEYEA